MFCSFLIIIDCFPCGVCHTDCSDCRATACDKCNWWLHYTCEDISYQEFLFLKKTALSYILGSMSLMEYTAMPRILQSLTVAWLPIRSPFFVMGFNTVRLQGRSGETLTWLLLMTLYQTVLLKMLDIISIRKTYPRAHTVWMWLMTFFLSWTCFRTVPLLGKSSRN